MFMTLIWIWTQGVDASKGSKIDGVSKPQLELLKNISGAFRPGTTLGNYFAVESL